MYFFLLIHLCLYDCVTHPRCRGCADDAGVDPRYKEPPCLSHLLRSLGVLATVTILGEDEGDGHGEGECKSDSYG